MSTSERPVPAVGQVWKCNASSDDNGCRDEHELASTLEYGRFRDRKGFVCNPSGNMTFVRHAPMPETAPGLPGWPTTSVGSGSAAKVRMCWRGSCGNPALIGRGTSGWCEPCLVADGQAWRIQPEATAIANVPPTTPTMPMCKCPSLLLGHLKSCPLYKPFYQARHVSYEAAMASLRAEEGVPPPKKCSGCGETPCSPGEHRRRDGNMWLNMAFQGHNMPLLPKPAPWTPSVDPLFDIPGVGEFGSRKP